MQSYALLRLLTLASSTLPVGAYSYSEGLEWLVDTGTLTDPSALGAWLTAELRYGAIRIETAGMIRGYQAAIAQDIERLHYWNDWLAASRETEELRLQSWQMGRSLLKLWQALQVSQCEPDWFDLGQTEQRCHFAIAFGLVAADWQIEIPAAILGYLHSWVSNLVAAGIKLIPLGQTAGQQLLLDLGPIMAQAAEQILHLQDEALEGCGWGLSLASMAHETQYSRLFRS